MSVVTVGDEGAGRRPIWIIARQHPGETMAEWFAEGMLDRLLDERDPLAAALLARAVFYVVPSMNPDGGVLGNLRTNAAGANLNREWPEPSAGALARGALGARRDARERRRPRLDVHGDEALPYVFVDGCERLPGFTADQLARQRN